MLFDTFDSFNVNIEVVRPFTGRMFYKQIKVLNEVFKRSINLRINFLIKGYFNEVEKKVAYLQYQFDRAQKVHVAYGS